MFIFLKFKKLDVQIKIRIDYTSGFILTELQKRVP